jgi:hypothetical protein
MTWIAKMKDGGNRDCSGGFSDMSTEQERKEMGVIAQSARDVANAALREVELKHLHHHDIIYLANAVETLLREHAELQAAIVEGPPKIDKQREVRLVLAHRRIEKLRIGLAEIYEDARERGIVLPPLLHLIEADDKLAKEMKP